MRIVHNRPSRWILFALIVGGILCGCSSAFQHFDNSVDRGRFGTDYGALENALEFYDRGEIKKALEHFVAIKRGSASSKVAKRAWLGEICCRLILAETSTEFTEAIGMWHELGESVTDEHSIWNQALMDRLIVRLARHVTPREVPVRSPAVQPPPRKSPSPALMTKSRPAAGNMDAAEIESLKSRARRSEQLQQRIDRIQAENRTLKEKIKALEAIDQKIQQQKSKIATPGQ